MKKLTVVHPLLFAMFPILALYAYNVAEVSPSEIVLPTAIVLSSTVLLLLLSGAFLRNLKKAGIIVSIFLVLFFSYGHARHFIDGWAHAGYFLMSIWGMLFISSAYFVIKTRRDLHKPTTILNIVAVTLVIIPTISVVVYETRVAGQDTKTAESVEASTIALGEADTLPDIYYIVLERYASATTLKEVYDFDNSEFLDYLSNKGFYVASQSRSNYLKTGESLASSLNLEYVNYLSYDSQVREKLKDYTVWRSLKSKGYIFIHTGNWWEATRENKYADMNINYYSIPEFSMLVFETTMLYPICQKLHIIAIADPLATNCNRILYQFEELAKIPNIKEPTFVFAHMFVSHPPYFFDRSGNCVLKEHTTPNYVDTIIFTNNKLRLLIDELLASSEVAPIIILQADEGPFPERYAADVYGFKWKQASEAELQQKTRIFNAYYLPNADENVLYPSITPVNSFRVVFNLYFDTDLELLPDVTYAFEDGLHKYNLFDVTDKVDYD